MPTEKQIEERRVATLRRVDGVYALLVRREQDGDEEPVYSERTVLVSDLDAAFEHPVDASLSTAWTRLSSVAELTESIVDDLHHIVEWTVIDPEGDRPQLRSLTVEGPPKPHVPTAANPRAYRGTKDRPLKPRRPEPMDLRPFLCVAGGHERIVDRACRELGFERHKFPAEPRRLPPAYRRSFAWIAHRHAGRWIETEQLHHLLDLENDTTLRRALVHHAATLAKPGVVLGWMRLLVDITQARRVALVELWRGDALVTLDPATARAFVDVDLTCTEENFETRMKFALSLHAHGEDVERSLPGFALADEHNPKFGFWSKRASWHSGPLADAAGVRAVRSFVSAHCEEPDAHFAITLWRAVGLDPALATILDDASRRGLDDSAAIDFAYSLAHFVIDEFDEGELESWREHAAALSTFLDSLQDLSGDFQRKAMQLLREFVDEEELELLEHLPRLVELLCAATRSKSSRVALAIETMSCLEEDEVRRFLAAPEQSFAVLDKECRRKNDAWLITYGLVRLFEEYAEVALDAFESHPRALCRVAKTLGVFSPTRQREFLWTVRRSALGCDLDDKPVDQLVVVYDAVGPSMATSPVPKKLRDHLAGRVTLSAAQLDRAAARIREAWPAVICEAIRELALQQLSSSLGLEESALEQLTDGMLHALQVQSRLDSNRRSLRRLLRACFTGDAGAFEAHPANVAWLRKHPRIDAQRWTKGFERSFETRDAGTVVLSLETDPLEALRLGTYVGSCLGLGGSYTDSAAAIVLDINKQVIFARDPEGRFLARQVVAINERDQLVCYEIYASTKAELSPIFAAYDRALAAHVGVEVLTDRDEHDEDQIAMPVAQSWWDDGIWDLDCGSSRATKDS